MNEPKLTNNTIGTILLESGKLSVDDADKIMIYQKAQGLRFGDAAVKLGLLTDADIKMAVSKQFNFSYLSIEDESVDRCLISAFMTSGPEVEAFRKLRAQLSMRWMSENKSIVVTSPESNVGTSYVSANLAVMFAQSGHNTLLIDADMRNPSQHRCFRNPNKSGLSDVLANRAGLDCILPIKGLNNLSVMFSGTVPPNPLELLGKSKFSRLSADLRDIYDVIIIDSPALLEFSDAELLVSDVKGALLVARKNKTEVANLKKASHQVELSGAVSLGVVMNDF